MFEYIQIKTILNPWFEIVLKSYLKRSKLKPRNAHKSGLFCVMASEHRPIDAEWLRQRKQFLERGSRNGSGER
jgi:hypothetical protein